MTREIISPGRREMVGEDSSRTLRILGRGYLLDGSSAFSIREKGQTPEKAVRG